MATHCQFCDKEMMFELQATIVEGYITCGNAACKVKAETNARETRAEVAQAEAEQVKVCIFSSPDFEDDSKWKLIPQNKHPAFLDKASIMGHMLHGGVVTVECDDGNVSYCAKTIAEVKRQVKEHFAAEGIKT